MANRDRTDPHKSAQAQIFRGAGQNRGSVLGAEGGKPESDIGNTQPLQDDTKNFDTKTRRGLRKPRH